MKQEVYVAERLYRPLLGLPGIAPKSLQLVQGVQSRARTLNPVQQFPSLALPGSWEAPERVHNYDTR